MRPMAERTHYVYRILDGQDRALYVGCTHNPESRYASHRSEKARVIEQAGRYLVTVHRGRAAGRDAEKNAIAGLEPLYNAQVWWMGTSQWHQQDFLDHASALAELEGGWGVGATSGLGTLYRLYQRRFGRDLFKDIGPIRAATLKREPRPRPARVLTLA